MMNCGHVELGHFAGLEIMSFFGPELADVDGFLGGGTDLDYQCFTTTTTTTEVHAHVDYDYTVADKYDSSDASDHLGWDHDGALVRHTTNWNPFTAMCVKKPEFLDQSARTSTSG